MPKLPGVVPVTDLRQDAAAVLKRLRESPEPIVITQRGRAAAVLLGVDAYEAGEEQRRVLEALAHGERDIKAGRVHELEDVLRELDDVTGRAKPKRRARR